MEARLLYLETMSPPGGKIIWSIVNGIGVPISQAQIPTAPPPLFTDNIDRRALIEHLTAEMARHVFGDVEPDWSTWQLHHIGKLEVGLCSSGELGAICSAIIVRNKVTGSVQASQAQGKATTSGGGK